MRSSKLFAAAAFAALVIRAPLAWADAKACIEAHEQGQAQQQQGRLITARDTFASCAKADCPEAIAQECGQRLEAVTAAIPTVVFGAVDDQGRDVADVTVIVDGSVVTRRLTGIAVAVDPGPHRVRFEGPEGATDELTVLAREGERSRRVDGRLRRPAKPAPAPAVAAPPPERATPVAPWVAAGVGVAALGSFTVFGLLGRSQERILERDCAPDETCTQRAVDVMRQRYLAADISLVVTITAAALSAYLFIDASEPTPADHPATAFQVGVDPHGASVGWRGAF